MAQPLIPQAEAGWLISVIQGQPCLPGEFPGLHLSQTNKQTNEIRQLSALVLDLLVQHCKKQTKEHLDNLDTYGLGHLS